MVNCTLISSDKMYLEHAFMLAQRGRFTASPNPNVGCVIVRNGCIVGEGFHVYSGGEHAEIYALRMAGDLAKGSTVYVTLEPCNHHGRTPPCTLELIKAGVYRVVIGSLDPNPYVIGSGVHCLQKFGIKVDYNLMLSKAEEINKGFFKRMRTGLPWIRLKLASSLDGRSAMSSGESKWITSVSSRRDVQIFRAESDAILSTSVTVLLDNPMLNVRWSFLPEKIKKVYPYHKLRQPIRVIIDSANRVLPKHNVIKTYGNVILARLKKDNYDWPSSVEQLLLPPVFCGGVKFLDVKSLIRELSYREINYILVEAGATLSGALIKAKLVDELIIYQSLKLFGIDAKPLCCISGLKYLKEVLSFKLIDMVEIGSDIRLVLRPVNT